MSLTLRGINYDVGTRYDTGDGPGRLSTHRYDFDGHLRRDMDVITTGLHCNAVQLYGTDVDRLMVAARPGAVRGVGGNVDGDAGERKSKTRESYESIVHRHLLPASRRHRSQPSTTRACSPSSPGCSGRASAPARSATFATGYHLWRRTCPSGMRFVQIAETTPQDLLPGLLEQLREQRLPKPVPVFEVDH